MVVTQKLTNNELQKWADKRKEMDKNDRHQDKSKKSKLSVYD
jgi:hypothetical protein